MKTIGTLVSRLSRRRAAPETWLDAGLEVALQLIDTLKARTASERQGQDRLVELEAAFQSRCEAFLDQAADRASLPFYWQELFASCTGLRRVFQILLSYAALSGLMPTRRSFRPHLEGQGRLLENVREFFREFLANRKYARELLRSNQHELKDLRRLCLQGIASIAAEGQSAQQALRLLGLFNELASADAALVDCLEKVYIATSL